MECIYYKAPYGTLCLSAEDECLTSCLWTEGNGAHESESSILKKACHWLDCYFSGKKLPALPRLDHCNATPFAVAVRETLAKIPYGSTATYSDIAAEIGRPGAVRAVGTACARNPFHVFIPCHRVVPAAGGIGNYAAGSAIKEYLIGLEKIFSKRILLSAKLF
ncbi:MAG: methylated-DNA--[protein]-cysteine S-methyltransferase [Bacteroidales bacterium]|nr:methylated-DNA--[protein]-cysteine S-methyltransferase [Bacteroidales bacterium]